MASRPVKRYVTGIIAVFALGCARDRDPMRYTFGISNRAQCSPTPSSDS
jgi:hypothetical protein